MREIKFRYWDGQKMVFNPCVISGVAWDLFRDCQIPGVMLMQYIGKSDKYGEELYEGDIVEWEDNGEAHRGPIFFDEHAVAFRVQMKIGYFPSFKLLAEHLWKIGDIHSTPELL